MSSSLFAFVVSGLLSLPVSRHDRAPELVAAKTVQRFDVAVSITDAVESQRDRWPGSPRELAAVLLAIGNEETHFTLRMGRGEFLAHEGDPRDGAAQSVSYWQMKAAPAGATPLAVWQLARTDVHVAAREAARLLVNARLRCLGLERGGRDWVSMVVASYAGLPCIATFKRLESRVQTYRRLMSRRAAS